MNRTALVESTRADGLRAVREAAALPDLCHHAEYRIYVNGQYVESAGSLGCNAQRVLEFWQRRRRGQAVEARPLACHVSGCTWRQP
jgi:hypothetical protein